MDNDLQHGAYEELPEESAVDLKELLLFGIGRYRYMVVLLTAAGLAAGVAFGLSLPNTYTSIGKLHLRVRSLLSYVR